MMRPENHDLVFPFQSPLSLSLSDGFARLIHSVQVEVVSVGVDFGHSVLAWTFDQAQADLILRHRSGCLCY